MKRFFKKLFCKHKYHKGMTISSCYFPRENLDELWEDITQHFECCKCGKEKKIRYCEKSE